MSADHGNRIDIDDGNQSNPILGVLVSGGKAKATFIQYVDDLTDPGLGAWPQPGQILMQIGGDPETHRVTLDNVHLHDNGPTSRTSTSSASLDLDPGGNDPEQPFQPSPLRLASGTCWGASREPARRVGEQPSPGASATPVRVAVLQRRRALHAQSHLAGQWAVADRRQLLRDVIGLHGSFQQLTADGTPALPSLQESTERSISTGQPPRRLAGGVTSMRSMRRWLERTRTGYLYAADCRRGGGNRVRSRGNVARVAERPWTRVLAGSAVRQLRRGVPTERRPGDTVVAAGGTYPSTDLSGDKGSTRPSGSGRQGQKIVIAGGLDVRADYARIVGPIRVARGLDIDDPDSRTRSSV